MPSEKRNRFLDADESDDDIGGYASEEELRKGGSKRRKVEEDDEADEAADSDSDAGAEDEKEKQDGDGDQDRPNKREKDVKKSKKLAESPGISNFLAKKNLVATEKAVKKSGVIYLSRIPPFMKVYKLRSLLEPYGTINRIFLTPEDPQERARRVRNGGNKKTMFTEGWVEFVDKKDAKKAVDLLNAQTIGGKKGSYYRDDVWNLLYLKGFKWHNLTEQIASEAAERSSRMRAEIAKTTKENKEFVRNVERDKMLGGIQSKKKKQGDDSAVETKSIWKFEQSAPVKNEGTDAKVSEGSRRVAKRLLF